MFDFGNSRWESGETRDNEIRWFTSICESIRSESLVIALNHLEEGMERYNNMIHDVLSNLRQRTKNFSIYVSGISREGYVIMEKEKARKLLPRLYDEGLVEGVDIWGVRLVSNCSLLFCLLRSLSPH